MAALRTLFFFQLSLLLLPITVSSQARPAHQDGGQKISFTVSMSRPQTHLLEVEIRIDRGLAAWPPQATLVMPVWTPGSYLIREFERHVQDFVLAGSPAYEQGLNANDQIVALDGARVNKEMLETMLTARPPGDVIRLTIFRFDDLRTLEIRLGDRMDVLFRILTLSQLTEEQKQIYQGWMGEPPLT